MISEIMDGLYDFYRKTAPALTEIDFNEKSDSVSVNRVYMRANGTSLELSQTRMMTEELDAGGLLHSSGSERTVACIIDVPLLVNRKPYVLDIKKKNYNLVSNYFGLSKYIKYAHSATMTMDVTPNVRDKHMNHSYYSVFVLQFFGIYTIYDRTKELTLGICWGDQRIIPLFLDALLCLKPFARHQSWILLVTAMTFNAYHNWRLHLTDDFVAQVMKRTGYQGWDMTAHDMADGTLTELSAKMSGLATSLAANRRLTSMAQEIISAIEGDVGDSSGAVPKGDKEEEKWFNDNVSTVKQRLVLQHIQINLLLAQVQNQLTAVRDLLTTLFCSY